MPFHGVQRGFQVKWRPIEEGRRVMTGLNDRVQAFRDNWPKVEKQLNELLEEAIRETREMGWSAIRQVKTST